MEKPPPSNQKFRSNKNPRNKKTSKQPLKVVYIANPIKFNATASEFRALVQELTGQDATDTPLESPAGSAAAYGGVDAGKVAAEDNVHAEIGQPSSEVVVQKRFDVDDPLSDPGSYFVSPHHETMDSNLLEVLKNLDAM